MNHGLVLQAASDAPQLARWRTRLLPLLEVLRGVLRVEVAPLPSQEELRDLWISVDYFATKPFDGGSWARTLEALELLDLLARVDARVGWAVLLEIADGSRVASIYVEELLDARLQFALELEDGEILEDINEVFAACCQMVDVDYYPPRSQAFLGAHRLLCDAWSEKYDGQAFSRATHGRICIKPRLRNGLASFVLDMAAAVRRLARSIQQARTRWDTMSSDARRGVASPFEVPAIDVMFLMPPTAWSGVEQTLIAVAGWKLDILNLVISPVFFEHLLGDVLFGDLVCPPVGHKAVARLELTSRYLSDYCMWQLCLALALSSGLEEFVFDGTKESLSESHKFAGSIDWARLACVLFRGDVTHDIRSVSLQIDGLRVSDVDLMRAAIMHPDWRSFLSSELEDGAEPLCQAESQQEHSHITHLTLYFVEPESRPAVLELLRLIGESLECLALRHCDVEGFSVEFMDAVFHHCPQLKRLEIDEGDASMEWLGLFALTDVRHILPESLVLRGSVSGPSAVRFFQALMQPRKSITQSLRHLHWEIWGTQKLFQEAAEAWLDMLDANRELERSEIVLSEDSLSSAELAAYDGRFAAHNGTSLHDAHRRAFLSVLSAHSPSFPAALALNTEAVKLIMAFAWPTKRRRCG